MKFIVTRTDALIDTTVPMFRGTRRLKSSEYWPVIVEANSHEDACHQAYREFFGTEYNGALPKAFMVVAMIDATVVTFREKRDYTVEVNPYS